MTRGPDTSPRLSSSLLRRANDAMRQGRFDEALTLYHQDAEAFPELEHVHAFNVALTRKLAQLECVRSPVQDRPRRAAVFAAYSSRAKIEPYVLHYLRHLRAVAEHVVVVGDFSADEAEHAKLDGLVEHVILEPHGEYDFGSYKRGYAYLAGQGVLDRVDELILCNDSCYGPLNGFEWMFREMSARRVDFWGLTQNSEFCDHVQSYFVTLTRNAFRSLAFSRFIRSVEREECVNAVIQKYELGLTRTLMDQGFTWDTFINPRSPGIRSRLRINTNPTVFPNFLTTAGAQLVKVKALKDAACNTEGIHLTLGLIARQDLDLLNWICAHQPTPDWRRADVPFFSVILPVFNRAQCVSQAIDSLLAQDFDNYELIVVDDGSTDDSSAIILDRYSAPIEQGRLRLIRYEQNSGVSAARNIGLAAARGEWIAYLDSDNTVEQDFLGVFALKIEREPNVDCCYAMMRRTSTQQAHGYDFDYPRLLSENYIDLGVFVHRRALVEETGIFDIGLKRLVDWDFLIRIMRDRRVSYIPRTVMNYWDDPAADDRISARESYDLALRRIRQKNCIPFSVSTVIVPNGDPDDLRAALDYAYSQGLSHGHEVLVFDNSGGDESWRVIEGFAQQHSKTLRAVRQKDAVSEWKNFLESTGAARGDFVGILRAGALPHGDSRLQKKVDYLIETPDCPQVGDDDCQLPGWTAESLTSGVLRFANRVYRRHALEKLLR